MLDHLLPSEPDAPNPVFSAERARLGPSYARPALRRSARAALITFCTAALALWLWERAVSSPLLNASPLVNLTAILSVVVTLLASLNAGFVAVHTLEDARRSKRLEHLRVTSLSGESVVEAYAALAERRAWRLSLLDAVLRFVLALLVCLDLYYAAFHLPSIPIGIASVCAFGLAIVVAAVLFIAFILEAITRLRVLVLITLAAALRVQNRILISVVSVMTATLIHLVQVVALWLIWNAVQNESVAAAVLCVFPLGALLVLACFFGFYRILRTAASGYAAAAYMRYED